MNVDKRAMDEVTSNVSKCINEHFEKVKKEGKIEGKEETTIKIAKSLLDVETIALKTGLTIEEVENLK